MTAPRTMNPQVRGALAGEAGRAARLLQDFSGHRPTRALVHRQADPKVGLIVGSLDGVLYTAKRDGKMEPYIHEFRARSRPLLATSSDGTQLRIVGGRFKFTEAGIEDR